MTVTRTVWQRPLFTVKFLQHFPNEKWIEDTCWTIPQRLEIKPSSRGGAGQPPGAISYCFPCILDARREELETEEVEENPPLIDEQIVQRTFIVEYLFNISTVSENIKLILADILANTSKNIIKKSYIKCGLN